MLVIFGFELGLLSFDFFFFLLRGDFWLLFFLLLSLFWFRFLMSRLMRKRIDKL
ncbi:hypothetical protein D3C80_2231730 [compost metagenome]